MDGNVDIDLGMADMVDDEIPTIDFDFVAEGVDWCEQCKKLKQELQQLQEDHALNYNTLKKKIISTDLLIKKYKAKSEDHEAQTKKLEETLKKCDQLQRESETLREQLGSSLQQLEPFKRAKESMEAENRLKDVEIQSLKDRLTSAVSARQQYENLSKSNSIYKDKYDEYKKEMAKKIQVLESSNQKQEAQISKLREDCKSARSDHSLLLKKHRKLEQRLLRAVNRLEKYWQVLKDHDLLPKGDKKMKKENYMDLSITTDDNQSQEEDTIFEECKTVARETDMLYEEEDDNISIHWSFSPMVHALSPLPPTPTSCRRGDSIENSYHSNSSDDEMADMLESQILHSSPVRRSPRKHSLWRQLPQDKRSPSKALKNNKKNENLQAIAKLDFKEKEEKAPQKNTELVETYLGVSKENCNQGLVKDLMGNLSGSDSEESNLPRPSPRKSKTTPVEKVSDISGGTVGMISKIVNDRHRITEKNDDSLFKPICEDENSNSNDSSVLNNGLQLQKRKLSSDKTLNKKSVFDSDSDSNGEDLNVTLTGEMEQKDSSDKVNEINNVSNIINSVKTLQKKPIPMEKKDQPSVLTRSKSLESPKKNLRDSSKTEKWRKISKYNKPISFVKGETLNPNISDVEQNSSVNNKFCHHDGSVSSGEVESLSQRHLNENTGSQSQPNDNRSCVGNLENKKKQEVVTCTQEVVTHTQKVVTQKQEVVNHVEPRLTRSRSSKSTSENKTSPIKVSPKRLLRSRSEPTESRPEPAESRSEPSDVCEKPAEIKASPDTRKQKLSDVCVSRTERKSNDDGKIDTISGQSLFSENLERPDNLEKSEDVEVSAKSSGHHVEKLNNDNVDEEVKEICNKMDGRGKYDSFLGEDGIHNNFKNGNHGNHSSKDSLKIDYKSENVEMENIGHQINKTSENVDNLENGGNPIDNHSNRGSNSLVSESNDDSVGNQGNIDNDNDSLVDELNDDSVWSPRRFTRAMSRQVSTGFVIKSSVDSDKDSLRSSVSKHNKLSSVTESIEEADEEVINEGSLNDKNIEEHDTGELQSTGQQRNKDFESKTVDGDAFVDKGKLNEKTTKLKNQETKVHCDISTKKSKISNKTEGISNSYDKLKNMSSSETSEDLKKEISSDSSFSVNLNSNNKLCDDSKPSSETKREVKTKVISLDLDDTVPGCSKNSSKRSEEVISPELFGIVPRDDISSGTSRSATPVSLSAASPMFAMSPLPMSPFTLITPLSPLPPSPVRSTSVLSPLPEDDLLTPRALVDIHHLSTSESEAGTPVVTPIPFSTHEQKEIGHAPCSFHSIAPSGVLHVKPKVKNQMSSGKPEDAAEDRINKPNRRKRKSTEKVPATDKKPCTDEISTKGILNVCIADTLSTKVLEREIKNYMSNVDNIEVKDFVQRLLTKDSKDVVMTFLIQWTVQALRCNQCDMLSTIYNFTSDIDTRTTGPFYTDQESSILAIYKYLIQNNIWEPLKQKILESLWTAIFLSPEIVPVTGKSSLCRFFTGICQEHGDVEQVRVMLYNCMTVPYMSYVTLGLAVVSIWPEALYKTCTDPNPVVTVMEHCIMGKMRIDEKQKHDKICVCYTKLCNWMCPLQSNDSLLKSLLQRLDAETKTEKMKKSKNRDLVFEIVKSIELLLLLEPLVLFKTTFVQIALNKTMQRWKARKSETNVHYDLHVVKIVGAVLPRKKDITVKYVNDVVKKYLIPLLKCKYDVLETYTVDVLLELSPLSPQLVFNTLYQWYKDSKSTVSDVVKNKLENSRKIIMDRIKFQCPPFS